MITAECEHIIYSNITQVLSFPRTLHLAKCFLPSGPGVQGETAVISFMWWETQMSRGDFLVPMWIGEVLLLLQGHPESMVAVAGSLPGGEFL